MRALIADDHDLVRKSIGAVLRNDHFETVRLAGTINEALDAIYDEGPFDIVFLDYNMPGMNGLDGLAQTIAANRNLPVALFSGSASPAIVKRALEMGAAGFIPKTLSTRLMVGAAKDMIAGKRFSPQDFTLRSSQPDDTPLSMRETEVLRGICEGKSNKEIARDLDLQEVTIKLHVKTLSRKLDAKNRTHAAMIARDRALL